MNSVLSIATGILVFVSSLFSPVKQHTIGTNTTVQSDVLGESTDTSTFSDPAITFNIPAIFNAPATFTQPLTIKNNLDVGGTLQVEGDVIFKKKQLLDLGEGTLRASNVVYTLKNGDGIDISGDKQNPTIKNTGVISLNGQTGGLTLTAGDGIVVDGLTIKNTGVLSLSAGDGIAVSGTSITNTDKGSSQNIFKTISIFGQPAVTAASNSDTLTFENGNGISISSDPVTKKLTVAADGSVLNVSGIVRNNSGLAYLQNASDNFGVGTTDPTSKLSVVGATSLNGTLNVTGSTTLNSTLTVSGSSTLNSTLTVSGATTLNSSLSVAGGINNQGGGITNVGTITGATGFTSSGQITFSDMGIGIIHSNFQGVLSSSAVNLTNSDVTGVLPTTRGGTGLNSYASGDIIYASGTNTLTTLPVGSPNQVLAVSGGGLTWATLQSLGALCTDCIVNDPSSTQSIKPSSSSATGLKVKQADSGNVDIFSVTDSTGNTNYFRVDSSGNVIMGSGSTTNGVLTVSPTNTYPIALSPTAWASGTVYTGTITSQALTNYRTWTLPDQSGIICLTTGNCNGQGTNLSGSGINNYIARFNSTYGIENSSVYDNGNVGIGTTNTTAAKFVVNGGGSFSGNLTVSGGITGSSSAHIVGATTVDSTLSVGGNADLNGTLGVSGATTLSSTLNVTGATTIGGNLQVNGSGTHYFSAGNLGVGTTFPNAKFEVDGTSWLRGSTAATGLFVNSSGFMGLGTTNPGYLFDVAQTTDALAFNLTANANTVNNVFNITGNALTTAYAQYISSTSTNLSSGGLLSLYWNPGAATSYTGNLFNIGVGSSASVLGNIFNIQDNGSNIFSVNQSQIVSSIPWLNSVPGDVALSYDMIFNNPTASFIKSTSSLTLAAGEFYNSSDLNLTTYNKGNVNVTADAFTTSNSATVSGQLVAGTAVAPANIGGFYLTNSSTFGKALAMLNQTESQDILTASNSGTTKFVLTNSGTMKSAAGSLWQPLTDSTTALGIANSAGSSFVTFDSVNSRVGIGTTAPTTKLYVNGTGTFYSATNSDTTMLSLYHDIWTNDQYEATDLDMSLTYSQARIRMGVQTHGNNSSYISFRPSSSGTNLTEVMRVVGTNSSVGIKDSNPQSNLSVGGNAIIGVGYTGLAAPTNGLVVQGNVGIGITAPISKFHVTGATVGKALGIFDETGDQAPLTASASGQTVFTVDHSGRVFMAQATAPSSTANQLYNVSGNLYWNGVNLSGGGALPSGTAGQTLYNTGGTWAASSVLYNSGTAIGINNTSPVAALDIGQTSNVAALNIAANSNSTANIATMAGNGLTSGNLLSLTSTSTGLTTGALLSLDWSPGSATTATGDLFSLNIGANGNITNLFNIKNNGSSVFSVSQSQITAGVPMNINSPGDFGLANDLIFLNNTSSNITSVAPITISAGEMFGSSNLTLNTYNKGNVLVNSEAFTTSNAATVSAQLVVGTQNPDSANIGNLYLTNDVIRGKALAMLNQTESQDILTASNSGTTKFVLTNSGTMKSTAGSLWQPLTDSTTALGIANSAGSSFVTFDTVNNRVGIGSTAPGLGLEINGAAALANNNYLQWRDAATGTLQSVLKYSNSDNVTLQSPLTATVGSGALTLQGNNNTSLKTSAGRIDIQTTRSDVHDFIEFTTGNVERMRINNAGFIGIGTTNNGSSLTVSGGLAVGTSSSSSSYLSKLAPDGGAIFEGNVGIGTTNPTTKLFITGSAAAGSSDFTYQNSTGTTLLTLNNPLNTAVGVSDPASAVLSVGKDNTTGRSINALGSVNSNGADYAEYFELDSPLSTLNPPLPTLNSPLTQGSLVGLNPTTGKVRVYQKGDDLIGIISTQAGFVGNSAQTKDSALVGLVGQLEFSKDQTLVKDGKVYAKIDGAYVGTLLSNGKVLLKSPSSALTSLNLNLDSTGNITQSTLNSPLPTLNSPLTSTLNSPLPSLNSQSSSDTQLSALDLKVSTVSGTLSQVMKELDDLKSQVKILIVTNNPSLASAAATLSYANQVLGTSDVITNPTATSEANLSTTNHPSGLADLSPSLQQKERSSDAAAPISSLSVSGPTTLYDLSVSGSANFGLLNINGLDCGANVESGHAPSLPNCSGSSINTFGVPLKLQSLSAGTLEIMGGKIQVDTKGNFTMNEGDVVIKKGKIVGNDSIRGVVTATSNQTSIKIDQTWTSAPVSITATAGFDSYVWVDGITATGFTLHIKNPASGKVFWTAMW